MAYLDSSNVEDLVADIKDLADETYAKPSDIPVAGTATPNVDHENGSAGSSTAYARSDHVHPVTQALGNEIINMLSLGTDAPTDDDYYVSQYANGGTTHTTFHRRKVSALWAYIKGKIESILPSSSAPGAIAASGSAGSSTKYARADHTHASGITTGSDYIQFPNGTMFCYGDSGNVTISAGSYVDKSISFPKSFINTSTYVFTTLVSDSNSPDPGSISCAYYPGSVSTSGFTARFFNNSSTSRVPRCLWLAIGKWK